MLARRVKSAIRGAGGSPVYSYRGPTAVGIDQSDHINYWYRGVPAVMITGTAFLRNPDYHTSGDTAAALDYHRTVSVIDGVANAVLAMER
jgi:Peptidase family M28